MALQTDMLRVILKENIFPLNSPQFLRRRHTIPFVVSPIRGDPTVSAPERVSRNSEMSQERTTDTSLSPSATNDTMDLGAISTTSASGLSPHLSSTLLWSLGETQIHMYCFTYEVKHLFMYL